MHRASLPRVLLAAAVVATAGCANESSDQLDIDDLPPLTAVEELRIGDVNDPNVGFTRILSMDVGPDGEIFVVDGGKVEIRVYGPDGALLRTIGRSGEGPGEFSAFPRFGVVGDTVWAYDGRPNRITLFDREGALLSTGRAQTVEVPLWDCFGYVRPQAMREDGLFTSSLSLVSCSRERPATGVQASDKVPVPRVLFDASGAVVDTIGFDDSPPPRMARPPGTEGSSGTVRFRQFGGRNMIIPNPPSRLPLWIQVQDGRIVLQPSLTDVAEDNSFSLIRIGLQGDTVFNRVFHYRPVAFSDAELDSVAVRAARGGGGAPAAGGSPSAAAGDVDVIARALREEMQFPTHRPAVQYPLVGADQSVWLAREVGDDPNVRWIVLDDTGLPRGELTLPAAARVLWVSGDTFWAAVPDELEVPWLVRYRIER